MTTQALDTRNLSVLNGEKAIQALQEYIEEVKERRDSDLTEKQTKAMLRLADGLVSAIETQVHNFLEEERQYAKIMASFESQFSLMSHLKNVVTSALNEARSSLH